MPSPMPVVPAASRAEQDLQQGLSMVGWNLHHAYHGAKHGLAIRAANLAVNATRGQAFNEARRGLVFVVDELFDGDRHAPRGRPFQKLGTIEPGLIVEPIAR